MEVQSNINDVVEQAIEEEEIILESERECNDGEIEEIVEIIEEIEEVDDNGEVEQFEEVEEVEQIEEEEEIEEHISERTNNTSLSKKTNAKNNETQIIYSTQQSISNQEKSNSHIHYDASADWEDDEYEQEEQSNLVEQDEEIGSSNSQKENDYSTYNNGENTEVIENEEDVENSRIQESYEHIANQEDSVEEEYCNEQEIVQNSENNLVYTVLGSKKQARSTEDSRSDVEFVEVQQYANDNTAEDGTIYYAVNNGDCEYVESVEGEQYQYVNEEPMEQDGQEWEQSSQNIDQQEESEQDQIFLHEDEDGQLYFKNDNGQLQPVYLTPDGNYAIAENSSDEQDSQEDTNQIQEEQIEADNYVLPDMDVKSYSCKKRAINQSQHAETDDSTVTISLIISEDENGQKRTQVIIPTPAESKCNQCNKTFKSSLQLLKHNRLKHAREEDITTRNFPCDLCPKRFTDQNSLTRHRKIHTENRPFQCLECHRSFPTANTLRKHLSMHNPDSQPLPCIYCGRRFSDKSSLIKHEQSHLAGEKTHICDICQKCFTNITDLTIHRKNHDPDRKFDCEVCGREFNRLNNLQRHMMVHQQQGANEEILSCNVCGITYKFSSSLTRHMVTTHMNPEKLRQQAEEQRKKRENNYRRYLENRKMCETQLPKRTHRRSSSRLMDDQDDEID